MRDELTGQIEDIIMPFIDELAIELIDLTVKKHNKTYVVDIIADRFKGGITIDECAFINKKAVKAIEMDQCLGEDFIVEVASPGLDRALKSQRDFMRVIGRKVRVHLLEPVEGKIEHHGEVVGIEDDQVLICTKEKKVCIPLEQISKAVQVIE